MAKRDMLPANATPLERSTALAAAGIERVEIPLRALWDPYNCPEPFLVHLASAWSVDRWVESWPVDVKRRVIAESFNLHQRKGTRAAIRKAVEPLGFVVEFIEWYRMAPRGVPGTFRLSVGVLDTGITEDLYYELERLIDDAKPLSRHLIGLSITMQTEAQVNYAVAAYDGDTMTVYPYIPEELVATATAAPAIGQHIIDTVTVYP
ncbi:phage tail protein [Bordetella sp. H567]|uniref:phage tail protein I n=1 Tax=Bordetella sp. H567 TaxID=1697043 RepID=UPI00081C83E2|nr:phage tail protein I [Bordetella sp. H567]AOB29906.1 phage tail protein [Bordetella sp. H567]